MLDIEKLLNTLKGQVPNDLWFVYAGLVFQANDRMDYIGKTWDYILKHTPNQEEQVVKARKLREALLKSSVLVGFPKVTTCTLSFIHRANFERASMLVWLFVRPYRKRLRRYKSC